MKPKPAPAPLAVTPSTGAGQLVAAHGEEPAHVCERPCCNMVRACPVLLRWRASRGAA